MLAMALGSQRCAAQYQGSTYRPGRAVGDLFGKVFRPRPQGGRLQDRIQPRQPWEPKGYRARQAEAAALERSTPSVPLERSTPSVPLLDPQLPLSTRLVSDESREVESELAQQMMESNGADVMVSEVSTSGAAVCITTLDLIAIHPPPPRGLTSLGFSHAGGEGGGPCYV